jgi:hypothetical protein
MASPVVGIYSPALDEEIAPFAGSYRGPLAKYRRVVWYTAAPRTEQYMRDLFRAVVPDGLFLNTRTDHDWGQQAAAADLVVLLYPDSIGLGFWPLERKIWRLRRGWAAVRVLNGRRREFVLTRSVIAALRFRRVLSRLLVGEALFTAAFVLATPVFLLHDVFRRRK